MDYDYCLFEIHKKIYRKICNHCLGKNGNFRFFILQFRFFRCVVFNTHAIISQPHESIIYFYFLQKLLSCEHETDLIDFSTET